MAWCWFNATESKPQNVGRDFTAESQKKEKMYKKIILLIILIVSSNIYSQTFDEKYTIYIDTIKIENENIVFLRVPDKKIKSPAKNYVISLQTCLGRIQNDIKNGKTINSFDSHYFKTNSNSINYKDKNWKLEFYENEFKAYENIIANKNKKNYNQFLKDISKKEELPKEDIRYVNIGELTIYSDTTNEAEDIGHLPTHCAIKVIKDLDNGYSQILACNFKNGYVKTKYLVKDRSLITIESEFKVIEHNFCFVIFPDNDEMYYNGYISEKFRTYYLGPKGGCYYVTRTGSKVYVDRNVCN